MGRNRILTESEEQDIVDFWLAYKTVKQRCTEAGISVSTLHGILVRRGIKKHHSEAMCTAKQRMRSHVGMRPRIQ
jgi:hypothetical protein